MNEFIQNNNLLENTDNNKVLSEKKYYKYENKPLLLIIQLIVCAALLIGTFTLKFIGANCFDFIRNWYFENINNTIISDFHFESYKKNINFKLPFVNSNNKEKIINTSFINSDNNIEFVPIELSIPVSNPLKKGIVTSKFGKRNDPISGEEKFHYGLDICAEYGTPIYAVMPGIVEKAENSPSFGNVLILNHGNNIKTLYAHCKELKVNIGDKIKRGQNIASMGNTGNYSTGTHLHVEFIINDKKYDPEPFFENICV